MWNAEMNGRHKKEWMINNDCRIGESGEEGEQKRRKIREVSVCVIQWEEGDSGISHKAATNLFEVRGFTLCMLGCVRVLLFACVWDCMQVRVCFVHMSHPHHRGSLGIHLEKC